MTDVVREFEQIFVAGDDRYRARVVVSQYRQSLWQGWIEFIPIADGAPCRTDRETVQSDRSAAVYWAEGLEPLYLDGAFERACRHAKVKVAQTA